MSISAGETIFEDVNLRFKHRLALYRRPPDKIPVQIRIKIRIRPWEVRVVFPTEAVLDQAILTPIPTIRIRRFFRSRAKFQVFRAVFRAFRVISRFINRHRRRNNRKKTTMKTVMETNKSKKAKVESEIGKQSPIATRRPQI
jgi:hypothetical protein